MGCATSVPVVDPASRHEKGGFEEAPLRTKNGDKNADDSSLSVSENPEYSSITSKEDNENASHLKGPLGDEHVQVNDTAAAVAAAATAATSLDSKKEQQVEKKVDDKEGQSTENKRSRSTKSFVAADASESDTVESDDEVEPAAIQEMKPKIASMVEKDDKSRNKEDKAVPSSSSTNLDRASKVPTRTGSSPSPKEDKPCDEISTANSSVVKKAVPRIRPSESVDNNKAENEQQSVLNDYKKVSLSTRSFVADGASESETVQSEEGPSVIQEVAKDGSDGNVTAITAVTAVATDDCSDADKKAQPNGDTAFAMPTPYEKPEEPTTTGLVESQSKTNEKSNPLQIDQASARTDKLVGKQTSSVRSFVPEGASESETEESDDEKEHTSSSAAAMTENGAHSAEESLCKLETLNDLAVQRHSVGNDDAKQVTMNELHRSTTGKPQQRKQPDDGSSDSESSGSTEENAPDERENAHPLESNESSSLPAGSQPPVDDDGESSSDLDSPKYGSAPRLDRALELELKRLSADQSLPENALLDKNRGGVPGGDGCRGDIDGDEESLKGMLILASSVTDDHDTGGKSTERLTTDSSRLEASITFDGHYGSGNSLELSSFCVNDLDGVVGEVEKKKKYSKSKNKDKNCAVDRMHHSCPKDLSATKTKQNLSSGVELAERPSHKSLSTGMWQQGMDESSSSTHDSSNNDDESVDPLESSVSGKSLNSFSISVTTRESDEDNSDSDEHSEAKTTKKSLKKGKSRKKKKKSKNWKPQKVDDEEESAVHPDWFAPPQERKGIFGIAGHVLSQSSLESADLNTSQSSRLSVKSPKNGLSPKGLIDKADITEVSKEFAKQLKSDALNNKDRKAEFFDLLNLDPWSEDLQLNEEKIVDIILEQPGNCRQKYNLEAFQGRIFPLSALCALGASSSTIKKCYEAHKDAILETDAWIGTALHYACAYKSRVKIVEFLVEKESSALREVNQFKRMPLHMACMFGSSNAVISFLIKACPSACRKTDEDGMTPLHLLCDSDHLDAATVDVLLEENPIVCSMKTKVDGSTPLHLAVARNASIPVLKALIKGDENALSTMDDRGRIPLFVAVAVKADLETFKLLLVKYPQGRNVKNKVHELPCIMAARMKLNAEILALLEPKEHT